MADSFAVIECDGRRVRCHAHKGGAECIEDVHFGVGDGFFGNSRKIGFSDEANQVCR